MNFEQIEKLIQLTNESDLSELTIKDKGFQITLKKEKKQVAVQPQAIAAPVQSPVATSAPEVTEVAPQVDKNTKVITAPMVGVFYKSPGPELAPFVSVGDEVNKGDVICILEAMKLMNEVECEFSGKVTKVLAENGQVVEYGQPLIEIKVAP